MRMSRLQDHAELIEHFPVLARLGEGVAKNYVACYVDVATADQKWVTDVLVEEGQALVVIASTRIDLLSGLAQG